MSPPQERDLLVHLAKRDLARKRKREKDALTAWLERSKKRTKVHNPDPSGWSSERGLSTRLRNSPRPGEWTFVESEVTPEEWASTLSAKQWVRDMMSRQTVPRF